MSTHGSMWLIVNFGQGKCCVFSSVLGLKIRIPCRTTLLSKVTGPGHYQLARGDLATVGVMEKWVGGPVLETIVSGNNII